MKNFRLPARACLVMFGFSVLVLPFKATAQDTINPYDENVNSFLDSMGIKVQLGEVLWSDQDFVEFVQSQQNLEAKTELLIDTMAELFIGYLELYEKGANINDPRFQELFKLSKADKEELNTMKQAFLEEWAKMKNNPDDLFSELWGLGLGDSLWQDESIWDDCGAECENLPTVFAYSDAYDLAHEGNIVYLYGDYYTPVEGSDVTVTWEQTYGPEVTWLNVENKTDAAFIVPNYDDFDDK